MAETGNGQVNQEMVDESEKMKDEAQVTNEQAQAEVLLQAADG